VNLFAICVDLKQWNCLKWALNCIVVSLNC